MKAEVAQQRMLLELVGIDAELTRAGHRAQHLPERAEFDRIEAEHTAILNRGATFLLRLEDLDAHCARLESEIDAVAQRERRDRDLLNSGSSKPQQVADLEHELTTLKRRRDDLEESLLAAMEEREELQTRHRTEATGAEGLAADLDRAREALREASADIDAVRDRNLTRRAELVAALNTDLLALYERQHQARGVGAGQLRGAQCGACRIEIDRGELSRIAAAADDDVLRCPECGAILLRLNDSNA